MEHLFLKRVLKQPSVTSALPMLWVTDREAQFAVLDASGCDVHTCAPEEASSTFEIHRRIAQTPEILKDTQRALAGETVVTEVTLNDQTFQVEQSPLRDASAEATATGSSKTKSRCGNTK